MAYDAEGRPREDRSFAELLSELASETGLLLRQEVRLFKAELGEQLSRAGTGAGLIAAGAIIGLSGWLVLLAAAVLGLAHVVTPWLAALIVAIVVLALAGFLVLIGRNQLGRADFVPRRTLASLREDEAWIREQFR
jgi:hypothetical protein